MPVETETDGQDGGTGTGTGTGTGVKKLFVFVIVVAGAAAVYILFGEHVSLANLAAQEKSLRAFQVKHPSLIFGLAFLAYVAVTGLSLPGAAGLTLLFGWYFGFGPALVLVSFASTTGATVAFLLSRYLFRDSIQNRFGDRLEAFNQALQREGAFYLFTLRLIPVVPFFVINVVMGLTPLRVPTYWWISQLGMLPGTCVYVYAGSAVPNLQTLADDGATAVFSAERLTQLFVAFALLGLFPLVVKNIVNRLRPTQADDSHTSRPSNGAA